MPAFILELLLRTASALLEAAESAATALQKILTKSNKIGYAATLEEVQKVYDLATLMRTPAQETRANRNTPVSASSIPGAVLPGNTPGQFTYETIVTFENEDDPAGRSQSVPVSITSSRPLSYYELQQAAMDRLNADAELRAKYDVNAGYIFDLDRFYILRVYQGV